MSKPIVDERAARRARFVLNTFATVSLVVFSALLPGPAHSEQPAANADVIASYRGVITASMLDQWQECRELRSAQLQTREHALEDLVVEIALADRWIVSDGAPPRSELEELAMEEAAAGRLREVVTEAASPSAEELRRVWEEDPTSFNQPRRWRLSNITLKVDPAGDEGEHDRRRAELEAIRKRVVSGEDFATLARQHSQSATAHRGGAMGFVTLDRLRPKVAAVVCELGPGDLSSVIASDNGVVLLLCGGVAEAESPSFEEIEPRLRAEIKSRRFTERWGTLAAELRSGTEINLTEVQGVDLTRDVVIAEIRRGDEIRELTIADLESYMVYRGIPKSVVDLDESRRRGLLREWVDLEVLAHESRARGLFTDADAVLLSSCLERTKRAQSVVNRLAAELVTEPTDEEIERAFHRHRDRFFEPRWLKVEVLRLPLDEVGSVDTISDFEQLAKNLSAGRVQWDQAVGEIPEVEALSWGWLTDKQVWLHGAGVERAIRSIEVGGVSPVAQEGRRLYVFKLVDEKPMRPLSLDEARSGIRASILAVRRKAAGRQIRADILEQLELMKAAIPDVGQQIPSPTAEAEMEP